MEVRMCEYETNFTAVAELSSCPLSIHTSNRHTENKRSCRLQMLYFIINNWQTSWMSSIAGLKKQHSHLLQPPPPPPSPTPALQIREDDVQKEQKKESTRPRRCVTSLPKYLSWPAGPHLHTDLQQITGAVGSPLMLQMLHHHPRPKETQNYWT